MAHHIRARKRVFQPVTVPDVDVVGLVHLPATLVVDPDKLPVGVRLLELDGHTAADVAGRARNRDRRRLDIPAVAPAPPFRSLSCQSSLGRLSAGQFARDVADPLPQRPLRLEVRLSQAVEVHVIRRTGLFVRNVQF